MSPRIRPYRIDWRFLPDVVLARKDRARHLVNRLGGGPHHPSALGRLWFAGVRPGTIAAIRRAGVLFVHVPRTGGTAISGALYGRNLPHLSAAYYRAIGGWRLEALPSFAIVRAPIDRLVSAYRFLKAGGTPIIAASRHDPRGLVRSSSFDAFVERLAADPDARAAYDPLRPQAEFVADATGRVLVDRLFAFEDLVDRAPALLPWIGGAALACVNASTGEAAACAPATRRLAETLYADDVTLYERVRGADRPAEDLDAILARAAG